jgi:transposase InsO family protein
VWIVARRFCDGWREHLAIVTPDTVVRWHRQGWHLFWRWKSRARGGRPHLFPVPTLTFKTLYVLVFVAHGRRELVHGERDGQSRGCLGVAPVDRGNSLGTQAGHLLRDRDAVYGRDFRQRARRIGVDAIATSIHSPRANAVAERVIGTFRRECLDHLIVLNEQHLRSVLTEFVGYYNQDRPHRTLGLQTPEPRPRPTTGPIRSRPVLNGLHHAYERAA